MENIFKKFFNKVWVIYNRPEIALLILKQICEDAKTHMRRVMSSECALMDLDPKSKDLTRSKSTPNLKPK